MKLYTQHKSLVFALKMNGIIQNLNYDYGKTKVTRGGRYLWNLWVDKLPTTEDDDRNKKYEWVEVFGVPRRRKLQGETSENTIRIYPNHLIIKIEVI